MKKVLLAGLLAFVCTVCAKSQTKGTNAAGFGVSLNEHTSSLNTNPQNNGKQESSSYSLSLGRFVKDNNRIALTVSYGQDSSYNGYSQRSNNTYGASIGYQNYLPLIKKLFAYAGGNAGYSQTKGKYVYNDSQPSSTDQMDFYNLGASGGLAYFPFEHLALEARLLSAQIGYAKSKSSRNDGNSEFKSLSLSSMGAISNLGFNIYFLF